MTKYSQYQVDAFAEKVFEGNPAAIVPLEKWISDKEMQNIAMENNLSETAFFVLIENGKFHIRWFTPQSEIDLCGHATLASAFIIFNEMKSNQGKIIFESKSGPLHVQQKEEWIELDFPASIPIESQDVILKELFPNAISYTSTNSFAMVEIDSENELINLQPNFAKIKELKQHGLIVTSKSSTYDFVSRMFAPKIGIDEDPVTGSAHCALVPYWANKLQKNHLLAKQVSQRGGILRCSLEGDRVKMAGKGVLFAKGEIYI